MLTVKIAMGANNANHDGYTSNDADGDGDNAKVVDREVDTVSDIDFLA